VYICEIVDKIVKLNKKMHLFGNVTKKSHVKERECLMDSNIIGAIIGAVGTITAALIALIPKNSDNDKKKKAIVSSIRNSKNIKFPIEESTLLLKNTLITLEDSPTIDTQVKRKKIKWRYIWHILIAVNFIITLVFVARAVIDKKGPPNHDSETTTLIADVLDDDISDDDIPDENIAAHLKHDFNEEEKAVTITGFLGDYTVKNLIIPNVFGEYPITTIGKSAFADYSGKKKIQTVTLPENLKNIGFDAFRYCKSLMGVTFSEGLETIGNNAFQDCEQLKELELPEGLISIGSEAFRGCINLEKVKMPNTVMLLGERVYYNCNKLKTINLSDGLIGIKQYTFYNCGSLESITIPSKVESIDRYAFNGCKNLTEVTINSGVKAIGEYAFNDCEKLREIWLPATLHEISPTALYGAKNIATIYVEKDSYAEKWCIEQKLSGKIKYYSSEQ